MEDFRAASEYDQDDWAEEKEYTQTSDQWARMFYAIFPPPAQEVITWLDPLYDKILYRPYEKN